MDAVLVTVLKNQEDKRCPLCKNRVKYAVGDKELCGFHAFAELDARASLEERSSVFKNADAIDLEREWEENIRLGREVTFDPFYGQRVTSLLRGSDYVAGIISYINWTHRWFQVTYCDSKLRIGFKFVDLGRSVVFCE